METLARDSAIASSRTSLSESPRPFPSQSPTPSLSGRMQDAEGDDADKMAAPSERRISTEVSREITKEEADASIANTRRLLEELRATMDRYESESPLGEGFKGSKRN